MSSAAQTDQFYFWAKSFLSASLIFNKNDFNLFTYLISYIRVTVLRVVSVTEAKSPYSRAQLRGVRPTQRELHHI
jgi:hypothetical protein